MKYNSLFDVVGPIMIGPSSSHTAGACKIGYVARLIFGRAPSRVDFYLHGSFASTYKGHGTDKALIAGVLGFLPDDERIRDAYTLAHKSHLDFAFYKKDLGDDIHSNSVMVVLKDQEGQLSIIASSVGGGNILVTEIDHMPVGFTAEQHTLITLHKDKAGIISNITRLIATYNINIGKMQVSRDKRKERAIGWIEVDKKIPECLVRELRKIEDILVVRVINLGEDEDNV